VTKALEFLLLTTLYKTRGDVAANTAQGAGRESRSVAQRHPVDTLRQGTWARSVPLGSNTSRLISTQDDLVVSWPARLRRQRACK